MSQRITNWKNLRKGQRYRVEYHMRTQTKTAVLTYLGHDDAEVWRDTYWDARPTAGTQRLPEDQIVAVTPVADTVPHHISA